MSIEFNFTAKAKNRSQFLEALHQSAKAKGYAIEQEDHNIWITLCPMGVLSMACHEDHGLFGKQWTLSGECYSTPVGAGLHKAAMDFLDELGAKVLKNLTYDDSTGYAQHRDFNRLKQEHFYPWLGSLVHISQENLEKDDYTNLCLCWDLDQYQPEEIPGTVVTPVGRFSIQNMVEGVATHGIEWFAEQFFLWDSPDHDARFYRNKALNLLWEQCYFAPSTYSSADAACNGEILNCLELASHMDGTLPLPVAEYEELCVLDGRKPSLADGINAMKTKYPIGFRKGLVTHAVGELRLTLPGAYRYEWEEHSDGSGNHLWYHHDSSAPVWRVTGYRLSAGGKAQIQSIFEGYADVERITIRDGEGMWGWKAVTEGTQEFFQAAGEFVSGSSLFVITATYMEKNQQEGVYQLMRKINAVAQHEPVNQERSYDKE